MDEADDQLLESEEESENELVDDPFKKLEQIYERDKSKKKFNFYISPYQNMVEQMIKWQKGIGLHRHLFPKCDIDGDQLQSIKFDILFDRGFFNDRHMFGINKEDN